MARDDASETAAKRTSGKRLALYWIGGLLAFALLADLSARTFAPERYAEVQAEREQKVIAAKAASDKAEELEEQADAAKQVSGQHCLATWDGSNRSLKAQVMNGARNPDSFEHIETRIMPAVTNEKTGRLENAAIMKFRAQNGFGGMNIGTAVASVDNDTCEATLISVNDR